MYSTWKHKNKAIKLIMCVVSCIRSEIKAIKLFSKYGNEMIAYYITI